MKGRWLWLVIAASLLLLLALVFFYPHRMISPGPLMPAHATISTDCFACHAPLRGASAERCVSCHAVPDIGLRTTRGVAIKATQVDGTQVDSGIRPKNPFHQKLTEQNCMACHSDHASPKLTQRSHKPFSHALLRPETRAACASCHTAPANDMHRSISTDTGCTQCHQAGAWKPATFEHSKFFVLDKQHNAACTTCHSKADYSQYTCFGCHEHTAANVRSKHIEEGIQNFGNCVECHRSADGEGEGKGSREGGKDQGRGERD
jgi:hypothetical protein